MDECKDFIGSPVRFFHTKVNLQQLFPLGHLNTEDRCRLRKQWGLINTKPTLISLSFLRYWMDQLYLTLDYAIDEEICGSERDRDADEVEADAELDTSLTNICTSALFLLIIWVEGPSQQVLSPHCRDLLERQ